MSEMPVRTIVYRLLLAWDTAWDKYKGYIEGVGALPGIALIEAANLAGEEQRKLGKQYWLSKIRSNINLAFRQAQSERWLTKVDVNWFLLRKFGDAFLSVCGEFAEPKTQELVTQHDAPDLWWWIRTVEGESEAAQLIRLLTEDRKAPIGFRPPEAKE